MARSPDERPASTVGHPSPSAHAEHARTVATHETHHLESDAERGHDSAELDAEEARKATEEENINALITHEVLRRDGTKELERPLAALAWSGLAAGLSMGLSMAAGGVLHAHLPDKPWRPLVTALGYSLGFLVVIIGSQQLYTENTLKPIVPWMAKRSKEMLGKVVTLWGVVLVANLLGAFLFALAAAHTDVFSPEVKHAFEEMGRRALEGGALTIFARAIFAGWIIALMVWMLPAATGAGFFVIAVMAWIVGAAHLSHIIVGSVEVLYLAATGGTSYGTYVMRFMLPALLGNTIGGVALVAALNHAQVVAGDARKKKREEARRKEEQKRRVVVPA